MRHAARPLVAGSVIAAIAAVGSCLVDDPDHCVNNGGNAACTEDGFPYCSTCKKSTERGGCVKDPPEPKCEVDDGGVAGTAGTTGGATADATAGDDAMSTGPVDCTMEGAIDEACPAEAAYCIGGTCASCDAGGEGFCAGVDASLPVCGPAGSCVACSADDPGACTAGQFCSPVGVCGGCTSHDQCAPPGCTGGECHACDFETGECFAGNVFWVDQDGCGTPPGNGTPEDPYCQISDAMANVPNLPQFTVRVMPSDTAYDGPISLGASPTRRVAVIGHEGRPTIAGATHAGNVSTASNRLWLSRLALENGSESTVRCASGRLWLDDVIVRGGPIGVHGDDCALLSIRGSVITGADQIGISADADDVRIINSAVVNNGAETPGSGGISLDGAESWTIVYSTVVANLAEAPAEGNALRCAANSPGEARNSIFLSGIGSDAIACPTGFFFDVVSDVVGLQGDGHVERNYTPTDFDNPGVGDFHLRPPFDEAIYRIGTWRDGDPATDVDGQLRPLVDGAADWVGFDVPTQ